MTSEITYNILIVDDNPNNLFTLESLLKQLQGVNIIAVDSGEDALSAVLENSIHLIFLDIQMPGMDGFETARHLKMAKHTRDIPIIFLSAIYTSPNFLEKGYQLGAVDYLTKPFDPNLLLNRVKLYQKLHQREQSINITLDQLSLAASNAKAAELRYRMVADFTYNWEMWVAPTGEWLYCSPSCFQITGYKASEFINNPRLLLEITHPHDTHKIEQHLKAVQQESSVLNSIEFRLRRADKQEIWIQHSYQSVFDEQGTYLGRRGSNRDISRKKQTEAKLLKAKIAAETSNKAKSVFLASMSHELRTPLNAILGFSEILYRDNSLDEDQKENLAIIHKSGDHLLGIINNILELSKIEAGCVEVRLAPFNIKRLISDITQMLSIQAQEKGLQLETHSAEKFPDFIISDEVKLRQILINLLSNAIKATDSGKVILHLKTQVTHANQLLIEVEDTGCGISLEEQAHIFEPFIQIDKQGKQKGTGLGLTITRQFIHLMGGQLSVKSTLHQGSHFLIDLPVQLAHSYDICSTTQKIEGEVTALAPGQASYRILVVDDQVAVHRVIECLGPPCVMHGRLRSGQR